MDEQQLRDLVKEEIVKYTYESQYNTSPVSAHTHNGTDSLRIYEKDIVKNSKYKLGFTSSDFLTPGGETFTITSLPNISRMDFHGFAANNADGTPATLRAVATGMAVFGTTYGNATTGIFTTIAPTSTSGNFAQSGSSMFADSTTLANSRVGSTNDYFVYVVNGAAAIVATARINSYTVGAIKIQTVLASNWEITGYVTFS